MYRDVVQWSKIRNRILVEGVSRRQVARETGISGKTVSKMLTHTHPQLPAPRRRNYRKLGTTSLDSPAAEGKRCFTASREAFRAGHLQTYPR